MSAAAERNVETVRRIHAAMNRRDFDAAFADVAPAFVVDYTASRGPYSGVLEGAQAARDGLESTWEAWETLVWNAEEIRARGDDEVLVVNRVTMRGAGSGVDVDARGVQLWTFGDDGLAVSMRLYQELDDVPAKMGQTPHDGAPAGP